MSALRPSFPSQYGQEGWRTGLGYRTRRDRGGWVLQRWDGEGWHELGTAATYDAVRTFADTDQETRAARRKCPYCAPDEPCALHV